MEDGGSSFAHRLLGIRRPLPEYLEGLRLAHVMLSTQQVDGSAYDLAGTE